MESDPNARVRAALLQLVSALGGDGSALGIGAGQLASGDPKFEDWDVNPNKLASWIKSASALKKIRGTPDRVAIQYARLKLSKRIEGSYPEHGQTQTWDEFTGWLKKSPFHHSYCGAIHSNERF